MKFEKYEFNDEKGVVRLKTKTKCLVLRKYNNTPDTLLETYIDVIDNVNKKAYSIDSIGEWEFEEGESLFVGRELDA